MMLSASDLQVLDLKAAGALSCSYVVCVSHTVLCDIKIAQSLCTKHHAPYCGHCQASALAEGVLRNTGDPEISRWYLPSTACCPQETRYPSKRRDTSARSKEPSHKERLQGTNQSNADRNGRLIVQPTVQGRLSCRSKEGSSYPLLVVCCVLSYCLV